MAAAETCAPMFNKWGTFFCPKKTVKVENVFFYGLETLTDTVVGSLNCVEGRLGTEFAITSPIHQNLLLFFFSATGSLMFEL